MATEEMINEIHALVAASVMAEQDRIIRLLKDYDFSTIWRQVDWNPDGWEGFGADELIAVIKGEANG
jgi:hypothetical protein